MKNKKLFIRRLEMTALLLAVYFIVAQLPIPFLSTTNGEGSNIFTTIASINGATSGGLKLFSLGLMPYFMSTLTLKALTQGISPSLSEMSRGTQEQRKQFDKISNYIFYVIALVQSSAYLYVQLGPKAITSTLLSLDGLLTILSLFLGALLCKYLADKITEHGISNGYVLVIVLMLGTNMIRGVVKMFSLVDDITVLTASLGVLAVLLLASVLIQRFSFKLPVTIDTISNIGTGNKQDSYLKDNFKINLMCVGITPIVYLSFVTPLLTALKIQNETILLMVSFACIYVFTEMSIKADFNLGRIMDALQFKGVYLADVNQSTDAMKTQLKKVFERIVLMNTLVLFAFHMSSVLFTNVPTLEGLKLSGIGGIQILMVGYALLDIYFTVKAHFVKATPEIIY